MTNKQSDNQQVGHKARNARLRREMRRWIDALVRELEKRPDMTVGETIALITEWRKVVEERETND